MWPCLQIIYFTCPTFIQSQQVLQTILDVLTPDDIRVLTECIDEDSRKGSFQRVFPTPSSHRYLRYMEAPRYYNLLVSQWVQRFNRMEQKGQGSNGIYCCDVPKKMGLVNQFQLIGTIVVKNRYLNVFFSYSGIALLEQFCDEGINLQNPTDDQNHQVTVSSF